jgi:hypothetical protein
MPNLIIHKSSVEGVRYAATSSGNAYRIRFMDYEPDAIGRVLRRGLGRAKCGSGHDCFLKGITVYCDFYCTQGIHRQMLRYRNIEVISSMSLEHCCREVAQDDFLMQNVDPFIRDYLRAKIEGIASVDWIINNTPIGVLLGMSIRTNYLQLKTIYHQRKTHRNPGWHVFCEWIEGLELFKELVLGESNSNKES